MHGLDMDANAVEAASLGDIAQCSHSHVLDRFDAGREHACDARELEDTG
jgi:hypothetical protein